MSASGKTSWYGFARAIFENDVGDKKLQRLLAVTSDEYPTAAKRPNYSLLNSEKLSRTFGLLLPRWERSLELAMGEK